MKQHMKEIVNALVSRQLVDIEYQYLDGDIRTIRSVLPIDYRYGRKGLHILTYSPSNTGYRQFCVNKILRCTPSTTKNLYSLISNK